MTSTSIEPADRPSAFRMLWRGWDGRFALVPGLIWLVVASAEVAGWLPRRLTYRHWLEVAAIVVLSVAMVSALAGLRSRNHRIGLWSLGLVAALLAREIHFEGSGEGIYVALVVLGVIMARRAALWASWLESPRFGGLLVTAFLCYVISQMLDQRWFKFLPGEDIWESPVEETMEVAGHLAVLAMVMLLPSFRPSDQR